MECSAVCSQTWQPRESVPALGTKSLNLVNYKHVMKTTLYHTKYLSYYYIPFLFLNKPSTITAIHALRRVLFEGGRAQGLKLVRAVNYLTWECGLNSTVESTAMLLLMGEDCVEERFLWCLHRSKCLLREFSSAAATVFRLIAVKDGWRTC